MGAYQNWVGEDCHSLHTDDAYSDEECVVSPRIF